MPGLSDSRWAPPGASRSSSVPSSVRLSVATLDIRHPPSTSTSPPFVSTPTAGGPSSGPAAAPHAPATHYYSSQSTASVSPAAELARYTKIVRRLKWKLPFLAAGYRQATERVGPNVDRAAVAEAELMFKLDFFEYYMLCERALVHLQGVFGIAISRDFTERHRHNNYGNGAGGGHRYDHRYHANVLEALDHEGNPLHGVLGVGEVRRQLARAKDLRNRWKNADDGPGVALGNGKIAAPLETYDLEGILTSIFEGFDRAFVVAERFVADGKTAAAAAAAQQANGAVGGGFDMETEEEQWEFMVDAMDWEAV